MVFERPSSLDRLTLAEDFEPGFLTDKADQAETTDLHASVFFITHTLDPTSPS